MTFPIRVRYQTIEFGKTDIHLCTLRDKQQFSDPDGSARDLGISSATWSLFGVIWPSSIVLANHMLDYEIEGKRILEIGCGMGLSSLMLNGRHADITATDYHPEAERFLVRNTLLNQGKNIAFQRVDWADDKSDLGLFDIVIGSDLLYEDEHIELLADFIQRHASPVCEVIIVDPGRGRKTKLSTKLIEYGFTSTHVKPVQAINMEKEFKGYVLTFSRNG